MADQAPLTEQEMAFAAYSAKRVVRSADRNRKYYKERWPEDYVEMTGFTDEEWDAYVALATLFDKEYGHLYDDEGRLIVQASQEDGRVVFTVLKERSRE